MFPPAERVRWQSLFGVVYGFANLVGPTLGGFLTDHGPLVGSLVTETTRWRWVFYINNPHRNIDVKDPAPARGLGDQAADKGAMIGEEASERWPNKIREAIHDAEQALPPDAFRWREHVGDQHKNQRDADPCAKALQRTEGNELVNCNTILSLQLDSLEYLVLFSCFKQERSFFALYHAKRGAHHEPLRTQPPD